MGRWGSQLPVVKRVRELPFGIALIMLLNGHIYVHSHRRCRSPISLYIYIHVYIFVYIFKISIKFAFLFADELIELWSDAAMRQS